MYQNYAYVPQSAEEQYQFRRQRQMWMGDLTKSAQPLTNAPQLTRPKLMNRPNGNLIEQEYRGWNMSGLNTYIVPQHEERQLALFSKYILKDPQAEPYSDLVSRAQSNIIARQGARNLSKVDIKQAYRSSVAGSTTMNPKGQTNTSATMPVTQEQITKEVGEGYTLGF